MRCRCLLAYLISATLVVAATPIPIPMGQSIQIDQLTVRYRCHLRRAGAGLCGNRSVGGGCGWDCGSRHAHQRVAYPGDGVTNRHHAAQSNPHGIGRGELIMRCPSCNKFATYSLDGEPEVDLDADDVTVECQITGTCRIVLTSECCGDDLKEASMDIDQTCYVTREADCKCDLTDTLTVESSGAVITERRETSMTKTLKDGTVRVRQIPYRYQKQYYGATVDLTVTCACGKTVANVQWSDDVPASGMDELV
jgi:hypothetical protein